MAITVMRAIRAFRSACAPITTVICFSFLLTWVFILYQPNIGPGEIQKLGWQSWEVVSMPNDAQAPVHGANGTDLGTSTDAEMPDVDWWNVTTTSDNVDTSSYPLDVWAPLLPHTTGRASSLITI